MRSSSLTSRLKRWVTVADWPWWQLPLPLRLYSGLPPVVAIVATGFAAAHTDWRSRDLATFLVLAFCGSISVASTPRIIYTSGKGFARDFSTMWVLPTALLLPPVYAALMPVPIVVIMQFFVHRGAVYRRVFTAAAISLSYFLASLAFRWVPESLAGGSVGMGAHAFTWAITVAVCYGLASSIQHFMVVGAVKLTDPGVRIWHMERDREVIQGLFVEVNLGVIITFITAISPALAIFLALPMVFLVRRFIVHPSLVAQSRIDAKTELLNASTWEAEAESELSRSVRTRSPLSVALIDIDHFKRVNDEHGHLVGDRVLKALAGAMRSQLRDYDRAGRFGGEEFVLLLAQTTEEDACKIAERLRAYVEKMLVPVSDAPGAASIGVTISIGVTTMTRNQNRELSDMLVAADSALYEAKHSGRNTVAVARQSIATELAVVFNGNKAQAEVERAGAVERAGEVECGEAVRGETVEADPAVASQG